MIDPPLIDSHRRTAERTTAEKLGALDRYRAAVERNQADRDAEHQSRQAVIRAVADLGHDPAEHLDAPDLELALSARRRATLTRAS
jgi:hypothetical protein